MNGRWRNGERVHFDDRDDAGRQLARLLDRFAAAEPVVLGLPRGGVPVAAQVAERLRAPLDVIVVRKLGAPTNPEYAVGAIGEDGVCVIDESAARAMGVDDQQLERITARERAELDRRVASIRAVRPRVDLAGRTAIVIDDGLATGSTARAACAVARAHGAGPIVLAVPVAPSGWNARLASVADDLVAVATPVSFGAVGRFYRDFSPTTDGDVLDLLTHSLHTDGAVGERAD